MAQLSHGADAGAPVGQPGHRNGEQGHSDGGNRGAVRSLIARGPRWAPASRPLPCRLKTKHRDRGTAAMAGNRHKFGPRRPIPVLAAAQAASGNGRRGLIRLSLYWNGDITFRKPASVGNAPSDSSSGNPCVAHPGEGDLTAVKCDARKPRAGSRPRARPAPAPRYRPGPTCRPCGGSHRSPAGGGHGCAP